jgi:hypothetical protein
VDTPDSRATELLRKNLSFAAKTDRHSNVNLGAFENEAEQIEVQGGKSGFWYRLVRASYSRVYVYLLDPQLDGYAMSFCVYSWEAAHNQLVWQDEMLMFALYLQHDEERFLRTAVAHIETMRMRTIYTEAVQKACHD